LFSGVLLVVCELCFLVLVRFWVAGSGHELLVFVVVAVDGCCVFAVISFYSRFRVLLLGGCVVGV